MRDSERVQVTHSDAVVLSRPTSSPSTPGRRESLIRVIRLLLWSCQNTKIKQCLTLQTCSMIEAVTTSFLEAELIQVIEIGNRTSLHGL